MAMTATSSNLQSLFFATIIRIAGDMRAFSLVTEGSLSQLDWCERWARGVPRLREEARTRLERAETALREFVKEEGKNVENGVCVHVVKSHLLSTNAIVGIFLVEEPPRT